MEEGREGELVLLMVHQWEENRMVQGQGWAMLLLLVHQWEESRLVPVLQLSWGHPLE